MTDVKAVRIECQAIPRRADPRDAHTMRIGSESSSQGYGERAHRHPARSLCEGEFTHACDRGG
jgi:hypothetical protein